MKIINFDGRIGANGAEVRTTRGGKPYVRFSVANNSFVGGQDKTEWYDITSYDPYVIENRVKYLTKGTYVIISGSINTEIKIAPDGKVWVNHYVTANSIDTPSFKKNDENKDATSAAASASGLSTYTGGTPSVAVQPAPQPQPQYAPAAAPSVMTTGAMPAAPQVAAQPQYVPPTSAPMPTYDGGYSQQFENGADDDLPF